MTKLVNELIEEDEREDWEYEHSINLACDFIRNDIIPLLGEFEENNSDKNYIDGSATHALFITLIQILGEMGFTPDDLKEEIDTYIDPTIGETIH